MEEILKIIANLDDVQSMQPATKELISEAEKELGVVFAEDYKSYVLNYGVVSAKGVELTGISSVKRLDVVNVTKRERELNVNMPHDAYVIENVAIDGIVMIQFTNGRIYSITMNGEPKLVCESLIKYLEKY